MGKGEMGERARDGWSELGRERGSEERGREWQNESDREREREIEAERGREG